MRLEEIQKVGFVDMSDIGLSQTEIDNAVQASTVMTLPLYREKKDGLDIFYITKDGEPIAWAKGEVYMYRKDKEAICIKNSYVDVNYRNKGIMTNLYDVINKQFKLSILSDVKQTSDAVQMWKAMVKNNHSIKKMNSMTGEISEIDDIDNMYGHDNPYVFLLEMTEHQHRMYEKTHPSQYKILTDLAQYPCEAYFGRP
jgi:predicted GNAT family acetyltransferase